MFNIMLLMVSLASSPCLTTVRQPEAMAPALTKGGFHLIRTKEPLRYVEYEFALEKTAEGVPRMNWDRFRSRPQRIVKREQDAIVLENRYFRATLLPSMGRLHSFIHQRTGREQLWRNRVAIPIWANNDTDFWVTWGGIEYVLPRREHGTSHALEWNYTIEEDSARRKAVRTWTREPLSGLHHTVIHAIYPDKEYLETTIILRNPGDRPVRFSHWTTALLAPGGEGQVTPQTEFIVPAERFVAADRDFNAWMRPFLGDTRTSPLRFAKNWKDIGDLMATPLTKPFYAAYCHEKDEAVVRILDLTHTPGFNIWTWGYPPDAKRQKDFTAGPANHGYVEFWNGTARDFTDEARGTIGPGETLTWREKMCAVDRLRGKKDLLVALEGACR